MATELQELVTSVRKTDENIGALTKGLNALVGQLQKTPASNQPSTEAVFGGRNVRTGEDPLSSRGYSFLKMLGVVSQQQDPTTAKIELDVHRRLIKGMEDNPYKWGGMGTIGTHRVLAPLSTSFLPNDAISREFRNEMKSLVMAGTDGADLDHMKFIRRKQLNAQGYGSKALSWLNELTGGALVAPPEQGELIELLRNKEALVNAGARVVPLPPQGRMVYPRQTAASTTYWVGENSPISSSDIGTGEVTLQAKKLAVLIKAPNELIRFASPAAEALLRDDMTKSLALGLDLAGLQGTGGDTQPLGIINMQNVTQLTSSKQTADGDFVQGIDVYRMIAAVEEANAEFEGWIMRPKTLYKYYQLRADAVAQGDSAGSFLFNIIREAGDGMQALLGGYPVTKSTQVSQNQTKGASSNLTYVVGGMWSDFLIGMFGAIEFAATAMGDRSFTDDQTWVRGILSADVAARHQSAFVVMNSLSTLLGNN